MAKGPTANKRGTNATNKWEAHLISKTTELLTKTSQTKLLLPDSSSSQNARHQLYFFEFFSCKTPAFFSSIVTLPALPLRKPTVKCETTWGLNPKTCLWFFLPRSLTTKPPKKKKTRKYQIWLRGTTPRTLHRTKFLMTCSCPFLLQ